MNWELDAMDDMDRDDDKEDMRVPYEIEMDNMLQEENNRSLDAENATRDAAKAKAKTPAELVKNFEVAAIAYDNTMMNGIGLAMAAKTHLEACRMTLLAAIPKPLAPCEWSNSEGTGPYESGCGHTFYFEKGDRVDNDFKFCPFCSGPIPPAQETNV